MRNKKGSSIIEYAVLAMMIMTALYVSRDFILRGFFGKYKTTGENYAFGKQYDATKTLDCAYDDEQNLWYDRDCFENMRWTCPVGDVACEKDTIKTKCSARTACASLDNGRGGINW